VVPVSPLPVGKAQTYNHGGNKVKAKIIREVENIEGAGLQKKQAVHISYRKIGHFTYIKMSKRFDEDTQGNKGRNDKKAYYKHRFTDFEPGIFKAEQQRKHPQAGTGNVFDPGGSPGGFLGIRACFKIIADGVYSNHKGQAAQILHVGLSPFKKEAKQQKNTY
jgi:hypothetical protein